MANIIPKRIFYVWDGPLPDKAAACIASWKDVMPDYEIIELNDASPYFDLPRELARSSWFKTVYARKMWAYVSDYIRVRALLDHGGIYFDTDITALRRFDAFLEHPFFAGFESQALVNMSVFGCAPGHPLLQSLYEFYQHEIWHSPLYTIPEIATRLLKKRHACILYDSRVYSVPTRFGSIILYPETYFYPYRHSEAYTDACITSDTHAVHWWNASWRSPAVLDWLATKHLPSAKYALKTGTDVREAQQHSGRTLKLELLLFSRWSLVRAYKQANTVCVVFLDVLPLLTVLYEKSSALYYLFNRFHLYTRKPC